MELQVHWLCFIFDSLKITVQKSHLFVNHTPSGGRSTQIKYLSKSTDTYNKILLQ